MSLFLIEVSLFDIINSIITQHLLFNNNISETPMSKIWQYPQQMRVARFTLAQQQSDLRHHSEEWVILF